LNFYDMRLQFDRILRTLNDDTFEDYRDDFLNQAWLKVSQLFVMPSLKREVNIDSVADQASYLFPYDYNGAEVYLWFKSSSTGNPRRLDPVTEEILGLMYERRTGNMGSVLYYDWTNPAGSDLASRTCTLVNNSATVACLTAVAADKGHWIRFDPFTVTSVTYDPGDYGYKITDVAVDVSFTLDRAYRGPAGSTTGRVRPAEQQQFIVYGNPSSAVTDAFTLKYYAVPRRLYNDADVPEYPSAGLSIVYMAMSVGYDYLHHTEAAQVWFGRAMNNVRGLEQRRRHSETLIHDLTIGSVSGRKTGPVGVYLRR